MGKTTMPVPLEAQEQKALFEWAAYSLLKYPVLVLMYAIPNGGSRDKREAHNLRMQGVKAGVPDICLPVPRGKYHGMYIEMKRTTGGRLSGDQKIWLDLLNKQGYKAACCRGYGEAIQMIEWYLNLNKEGEHGQETGQQP